MPNKPFMGLGLPRTSRRRTAPQRKSKKEMDIREVRLKNLEKARKKRKSNLRAAKKAARK